MAKNKLRTFLDDNPIVGLMAAVIILVASLGAIAYFLLGNNQQGATIVDVWFYDIEAKELFVGKSSDSPPIEAPSGGQGVRAYVFACNDCDDPNDRFIAWVEMYTPEYKEAMLNPPTVTPENPDADNDLGLIMEQGQLVARPDTDRWIPATSERAAAFMTSLEERCDGAIPQTCLP